MKRNTRFARATLTSLLTLTFFNPAHAQILEVSSPSASADGDTNPAGVPPRKFNRRLLPLVGLDYGTYVPVSERTRARFGGAWTNYGIALGRVEQASRRGTLTPEFGFLIAGNRDKRAIILPLGLEYQRTLGGGLGRDIQPYYRASINIYGTFLKSTPDNIAYGLRFAYGGGAAFGFAIGNRFLIETRHRAMTGVRGMNLSGNEIRLGIRF